MRIVCVGSTSKDIFFPTSEGILLKTSNDAFSQEKIAFELGAKYHIDSRYETLGGCSTNVAVGLAKLGETVSCYTTIGDDQVGKWINKELKKINVGIDFVAIENNCLSDLSLILVDIKSADRIIFSNQVANKKLFFDGSKIGNPHWIFIGDLNGDWVSTLDDIIAISEKKNIKLAFNPRQKTIHDDVKKIIETIGKCELLFVNKDEAMEIISGSENAPIRELLENEEYLATALYKLGAKIVAITDGLRGAWVFDGEKFIHAKALLKKAVDSTGAGDAFTSGFFAAYLKKMNLVAALKWGIANSSSSVEEYGGEKGLLDDEKIVEVSKVIMVEKLT